MGAGRGQGRPSSLTILCDLYLGMSEGHDGQLGISAFIGASSYAKFIFLFLANVTCRPRLVMLGLALDE